MWRWARVRHVYGNSRVAPSLLARWLLHAGLARRTFRQHQVYWAWARAAVRWQLHAILTLPGAPGFISHDGLGCWLSVVNPPVTGNARRAARVGCSLAGRRGRLRADRAH